METRKYVGMKMEIQADADPVASLTWQKWQYIIKEAIKQAHDESNKILKMVEMKGQLIIRDAIRVGEAEADKILEQARKEARDIVAKAREQARSYERTKIYQNRERIGQTPSESNNVDIKSQLRAIMPQVLETGFGVVMEATRKADAEAHEIIAQAKETGLQIIEEAKIKREGEAKKIVSQAEEMERQILEEARKKAEDEGNMIVTKAIQTGLQIIVEASRIAGSGTEIKQRISQKESKEHYSVEEAESASANILSTDAKYGDIEHEFQQLTKCKED